MFILKYHLFVVWSYLFYKQCWHSLIRPDVARSCNWLMLEIAKLTQQSWIRDSAEQLVVSRIICTGNDDHSFPLKTLVRSPLWSMDIIRQSKLEKETHKKFKMLSSNLYSPIFTFRCLKKCSGHLLLEKNLDIKI